MNRCFVCKELLLHMVSVSQCHAFAKRGSGPAGSYFKAKNRLGCLVPQNVPFGQARIAEFSVFDHGLERSYYWLFILLSYVLLFLCKKRKNNDKENLSLTGATTWQDNLLKSKLIQSRIVWSIRQQVASLTVCVSRSPRKWIGLFHWIQWIGWLLRLCVDTALILWGLERELKFLVWIKTSWGIGLLPPRGGMLHFDRQAEWYEIWSLCNLLRKDSVCASKRPVLLNELWGQRNTLDFLIPTWLLSFKSNSFAPALIHFFRKETIQCIGM